MEIGRISGDLITNPILACRDKCLRVMEGENVKYTVGLPGPGSKIAAYCQTNAHTKDYIYGLETGAFGMVQLEREESRLIWDVAKHTSSVSAICVYDMNQDGVKEICIGREDGTIEVYAEQE
jgi:Bardet-Biedl syndrome 7 protein